MNDAPETKWLTPNGGLPTGAPWPKSELVEYTRTDIAQARIAELRAALTWISLGPGYFETKEEAVLEMMRVSSEALKAKP
jgi:hypothetical protein